MQNKVSDLHLMDPKGCVSLLTKKRFQI